MLLHKFWLVYHIQLCYNYTIVGQLTCGHMTNILTFWPGAGSVFLMERQGWSPGLPCVGERSVPEPLRAQGRPHVALVARCSLCYSRWRLASALVGCTCSEADRLLNRALNLLSFFCVQFFFLFCMQKIIFNCIILLSLYINLSKHAAIYGNVHLHLHTCTFPNSNIFKRC